LRNRENGQDSSASPAQPEFVNPDYFRLLHDSLPGSQEGSAPPSPRRRFVQPALSNGPASGSSEYTRNIPSSPQGISSAAFTQGYFKKFFIEERELGRGGKGIVLLVKHVLDGVSLGHFACKRVPVGDDHGWLEKVLIEVQLLQHLSHQNLVSYRHVWLENAKLSTFGPSVPCAFILQQYCNAGDLHKYVYGSGQASTTAQQLKERLRRRSKGKPEPPVDLAGPRKLPFEQIYSFFRDITSGIRFLHANGYIHRDLKPNNCLLHETGNELRVLVSDFGEVQFEKAVRKSTGATGTISYCAPEVLRQEYPGGPFGNFTFKSDVFSLGMILHFLCFAQLPYQNVDLLEEKEDLDQLRAEISEWKGFNDALKRMRPELPDKLYTMLERLLSIDPSRRPTADEVLNSMQGGAIGNDSRRFPRSSPTIPDFHLSSRIQPVDSPAPASPRPTPRSPRKGSFTRTPLGSPGASRSSPAYEGRHSESPHLASGFDSDNRGSRSPDRDLILRPRFRTTTPLPNSSPVLDDHFNHHHTHHHSPPLLPPPPHLPPTYQSALLFYVRIGSSNYWLPLPRLQYVLFILKLTLTLQSCVPLAVNSWLFYPLMILASITMTTPDIPVQAVSLLVHVTVVALSARTGSLCIWNV
jgi:serine/threonine protein kinase